MIPLSRRPLPKGRGRVYKVRMPSITWYADYRKIDGTKLGVVEFTIADAADWVREKAIADRRANMEPTC